MRATGWVILTGLLVIIGAYAFVHGRGNFHEVENGVLYRSSRLGADGLENAIARYGIKSVLNLCGPQPGVAWYDGEVQIARGHGVLFRDLAISANQALDPMQLAELLEVLRDAPKPLLIHCRAGSDRTGLACALFVAWRGGPTSRPVNNWGSITATSLIWAARARRWTSRSPDFSSQCLVNGWLVGR